MLIRIVIKKPNPANTDMNKNLIFLIGISEIIVIKTLIMHSRSRQDYHIDKSKNKN